MLGREPTAGGYHIMLTLRRKGRDGRMGEGLGDGHVAPAMAPGQTRYIHSMRPGVDFGVQYASASYAHADHT